MAVLQGRTGSGKQTLQMQAHVPRPCDDKHKGSSLLHEQLV